MLAYDGYGKKNASEKPLQTDQCGTKGCRAQLFIGQIQWSTYNLIKKTANFRCDEKGSTEFVVSQTSKFEHRKGYGAS
jgi:hypothetical protein